MRTPLIAAVLLLSASAVYADQDVSRTFRTSIPRGSVTRVIIDIPAAEISVRNGASDKVTATGEISRESDGEREREEARKLVESTSIEIYVRGNEAVVRRRFTNQSDTWRNRTFTEFKLDLEVPQGTSLQFETSYGELNLDGRFGDIDIDLRAGEVDLRTHRADVGELNASCRIGEVRADLGDRWVKREGVFPGKTHFINAGGKYTVNIHVTAGEVDVTLKP